MLHKEKLKSVTKLPKSTVSYFRRDILIFVKRTLAVKFIPNTRYCIPGATRYHGNNETDVLCGYSYDFTQHAVAKSEEVRHGAINRIAKKRRHFGHAPF